MYQDCAKKVITLVNHQSVFGLYYRLHLLFAIVPLARTGKEFRLILDSVEVPLDPLMNAERPSTLITKGALRIVHDA